MRELTDLNIAMFSSIFSSQVRLLPGGYCVCVDLDLVVTGEALRLPAWVGVDPFA